MATGNGATFQNDLREFITAVEKRGELAHVKNAHWDRELGAVTEVLYRQKVEKAPMRRLPLRLTISSATKGLTARSGSSKKRSWRAR